MLHKIKILSLASLLALSFQTTLFAMDHSNNDEFYSLSYDNDDDKDDSFFDQKSTNNITSTQSWVFGDPIDDVITTTNQPIVCGPLLIIEQPKQQYQFNIKKLFDFLRLSDLFTSLQKSYNRRYKDPITTELIEKCKALKATNDEHKIISKDDIDTVQKLWDKYKSFYNYDRLDSLIYPLHEPADKEVIEKECTKERKIALCIHSDKYNDENKGAIDNLFTYLTDASRPTKSLDCIINNRIATNVVFHTSAQLLMTACALPSILFPDYFKSKNVSEYEHATKSVITDIKEHDYAIKHRDTIIKNRDNVINHRNNTIKQYNNAIRRTELNINKKQEFAKKALEMFSKNNN